MAKTPYKIPFNKKGDQMTYADHYVHEWRENSVFQMALTFETYGRGRSSVVLIFRGRKKAKYSMFMTDANNVIPLMNKGKINEYWTFQKRGQNYGIRLATDEEIKKHKEAQKVLVSKG